MTVFPFVSAVLAGLTLSAVALPAQETSVQSFGDSGNAALYGVSPTLEASGNLALPEDMEALVARLVEQEEADIAWQSVSAVTEVEFLRLTQMDGDAGAAGLSDWIGNTGPDLPALRDAVDDVPTLTAALEEAGLSTSSVIGAFGSAADTVALVIDDRG
jgi:translation initiation factor 6 (eIF-6)